ncbi:hypothetical protein [Lysobacter sp. HA35]
MNVAAQLLADLERHAVHIERHGDRLWMRAPSAPPGELRAQVAAHKPSLLAALPDLDARPVVHFRLPGHDANAWATYLGRPGESRDEVTVHLRERWPAAVLLAVGTLDARVTTGAQK